MPRTVGTRFRRLTLTALAATKRGGWLLEHEALSTAALRLTDRVRVSHVIVTFLVIMDVMIMSDAPFLSSLVCSYKSPEPVILISN